MRRIAAPRRARAWGRHRVPAAVGLVALALGAGFDCGGLSPRDEQPDDPLTVDWRDGSYDGLTLRMGTAALIARIGPPERRGPEEPIEPIGEDYYDVGGPTSSRSPRAEPGKDETLRYEGRAFLVTGGRISGWVTTSDRAQTPEGVGVGDSNELVEERYPDADCRTANEGTEYTHFPLCEVRACEGRLLAFGGDPIESVWLVAETAAGWRSCRNPTRAERPETR